MTATMAEINEEVSVNPDAQSAVTDFLDYTEYLPTDLIRSLTLIRQLDETYLCNADCVHDLTRTYGGLPRVPVEERPDVVKLRMDISRHLDLALGARESAYAEAVRLFDLTDRHQDRLRSIIAKLNALPKPPSRDPTPQPQPASATKRPRTGREIKHALTTRITLKAPKGPVASGFLARPRPRPRPHPPHRRVTVPGEVMPPFDPDEPIASTEVSDWESEPRSPIKPPPEPKIPKHRSAADSERKPRETATYRKPTPPPDDAPIGGEHRPWTHLTEYEMYKLRKKMKKNHTWEPSEVMIKRELAEKGRGWDNYHKAKAAAIANGTPFIDIEQTKPSIPTKPEVAKPAPKTEVPIAPRPKAPKRTDSKSEKKESVPKDAAALAAQEAQQAARRLGDIGSQFANLFQNFKNSLGSITTASSPSATTPVKLEPKSQKKRKLEVAPSISPSAEPETQPKKKPKLLSKPSPLASAEPSAPASSSAGTIKIPPLKLNLNPQPHKDSPISTPASTSRPVSSHRATSAVTKTEASPPPSRPPSRRSAAASVEPATVPSARPSRRTSVTPAATSRKTPTLETTPRLTLTAASRRSKREAPGTVTQSSQDGGAAVSVSKRKTKPSKPSKVTTEKATTDVAKPEIRTDIDGNQEIVDPDEERWCICGDVSYGQMIACELDEKCEYGEWFHMDCVGLQEMPPRTAKWYCPGDRKKFHKGEKTNGLVRHGS